MSESVSVIVKFETKIIFLKKMLFFLPRFCLTASNLMIIFNIRLRVSAKINYPTDIWRSCDTRIEWKNLSLSRYTTIFRHFCLNLARKPTVSRAFQRFTVFSITKKGMMFCQVFKDKMTFILVLDWFVINVHKTILNTLCNFPGGFWHLYHTNEKATYKMKTRV